ncbi:MAG TPA: cation:proton antiporter [Candidatus Nanoarchaeia archaeon]|nr:cation:proton antiporter [Candidatus Nanoarchaeia archaeon]
MIENILLVLLLLLLCAKVFGSLFEKIGLDSSLGELLTGILLGPSLLSIVSGETVKDFAIIGSVLILFVVGLKQEDIRQIYSDKRSIALGFILFFVTAFLMALFFLNIPKFFGIDFNLAQSVALAIAFSIIDVGVPAKTLISKGLIELPVGKLIVRSSIINILLGLLVFTFISSASNFSVGSIFAKSSGILIFVLIAVFVYFFFSRISQFVIRQQVHEAEFTIALLLVLALAYFTDLIGFSSVLGAFLAGVIITKLPFSSSRSFSDKIKAISFGLFVPLFFVWFGLEVNLSEIFKNLLLALVVFISYTLIRFTVAYSYLKHYKFDAPLLTSSSMLSVDVESLIVIIVAINTGIFSDNTPLVLFAPSVLLSTLTIVVLVSTFSKKELKKIKNKA